MTPAEKLNKAIEASRLAEANFDNYELYKVLMHRACILKLEHAKAVGSAAVDIIIKKYGTWINDDELKAESFRMALLSSQGIDSKVGVFEEGLSIEVQSIQSANTLMYLFRRHKPVMRADSYKDFVMFIPKCDPLQLISQ